MSILKSIELAWKHRGQPEIQDDEGTRVASNKNPVFYEKSYDNIEVVRRGADLIVNSCAEIDVSITGSIANIKPIHEGGAGKFEKK